MPAFAIDGIGSGENLGLTTKAGSSASAKQARMLAAVCWPVVTSESLLKAALRGESTTLAYDSSGLRVAGRLFEHVEPGAAQMTGPQRFRQRRLVDDHLPRGADWGPLPRGAPNGRGVTFIGAPGDHAVDVTPSS